MTKNIFVLSIAIIAVSYIWTVNLKENIYKDMKRTTVQIFGDELPSYFKVLKTLRTNNTDIGEIYHIDLDASLTFIWPDNADRWQTDPKAVLQATRDYRLDNKFSDKVPPFVVKYLSAHFDARRINLLREFKITKPNDIDVATFRLKDDRFYALAVSNGSKSYILVSSEKGPIADKQLEDIFEQIKRLSQ